MQHGDWRIDQLQAKRIENAFSLGEVKQIMNEEIQGAHKQATGNPNYVFYKKDGYLDIAPN